MTEEVRRYTVLDVAMGISVPSGVPIADLRDYIAIARGDAVPLIPPLQGAEVKSVAATERSPRALPRRRQT